MIRNTKAALLLSIYATALVALSSCAGGRGCPSNGANVGAERVLSGEKGLKQSKFKVKGMN